MTKRYKLKDHTVYTTLNPCAMCAGMMTLTSVKRTVYGMKDPGFGNALKRLQLNTSSLGGYKPYPRPVISDKSPSMFRKQLDEAYAIKGGSITKFLLTDEAKAPLFIKDWGHEANVQTCPQK